MQAKRIAGYAVIALGIVGLIRVVLAVRDFGSYTLGQLVAGVLFIMVGVLLVRSSESKVPR